MKPKDYLALFCTVEKEIDRGIERIATLRRMAEGGAAKLREARVRTSPDPGRFQRFLDEAADEETAVAELERKKDRMLTEIGLSIARLPEKKQVRLMELRYMQGCPWADIARRLHLCESQTFRLHLQALSLLPDFPEETLPSRQG